ncbi:hypothetical protein HP439_09915 [Sphingobacterium shayense]|uniref:hypothetical protein n=1 Tax=Sphingobacterium shayense TaxID=626343 RepID=UPI001555C0BE|nr:hypothetical protein [Sphingobacterium shayense]NQD71033.1 hypothetical protein [Sphingobacterium shayense]
MNKFLFFFCMLFLAINGQAFGQQDSTVNITDDIQVDVKSVTLDSHSDTLTVELFLISYQVDPREFKLNTFATQLVDDTGGAHLFWSIQMGRVLVKIGDRQNYLHYLIEENEPVPFTLKIAGWGEKAASKLNVVFEDSNEVGKYITHQVNLMPTQLEN